MANIILPRKWHTQPSFPTEADRSHPLLRGAIDYVMAGPTGLSGFYSLDTTQLGSTPVSQKVGLEGWVGRFTDASSSSQYEELPTVVTDTADNYDAFTIFCCGTLTGLKNGGTTNRNILAFRYHSTAVTSMIQNGSLDVYFTGGLGAVRAVSLGTILNANRHFDAFGWYDTATNTWKGQLDALAPVENTSTTTPTSAAADLPSHITGTATSTATPGSKTFYVGGSWWRVLDDGEKQALRENPWQVFVKQRPRIYSFSTGGSSVNLTLANAAQSQGAEAVVLTSSLALALANAAQSQGAEAVTLTSSLALALANAAQSQGAEAVTLTSSLALALANAAQSQSADNLTLTSSLALALANAAQAQGADNLALTSSLALALANAAQAQGADNLVLTTGADSRYARPVSDISTTGWSASSGSDLFVMLDETTPSDTDYDTTTGTSVYEFGLNAVTDPATTSGQVVNIRARSNVGSSLVAGLKQGATVIAERTFASVSSSYSDLQITLSAGEIAAITDYSALRGYVRAAA